jgi:hypothetical protein
VGGLRLGELIAWMAVSAAALAFLLWFMLNLSRDCDYSRRINQAARDLAVERCGSSVMPERTGDHPAGALIEFPRIGHHACIGLIFLAACVVPASAAAQEGSETQQAQPGEPQTPPAAIPTGPPEWQYGAFVDGAYLLDFNHPANDRFRSRGTTYILDQPIVNMAAAYIQKNASEASRWGIQVTVQAGQDTRIFGFSATAPNLPGSTGLRHLGPTNISYLAPVGKGLTIQGGIFSSLVGYDSLYAKDNFNYTRPWGADFTPYLMLGVAISYPFTEKLMATAFVVNGYWHLGNANAVPSWGGQVAYKATAHTTIKQTFLIGPHQAETDFAFWRWLSDSIAEWKTDRITAAFEYHVGTERVAAAGQPRALWMAAQLPLHIMFNKYWSVTIRPEVYWDRDGRLTGFAQTVKANTTTLEYRIPYKQLAGIFRVEHRIDDSRGPQGGFFRGGFVAPGIVGLTPTQNLFAAAAIVTFDSAVRP